MSIRVETYSGYAADEAPRRFEFEGALVEVLEIVKRWRTPFESGFQVRAGNGRSYILTQETAGGEERWEVEEAKSIPGRT